MQISQRSPDSFFYSGGKTGILLLHGFTGTPSELRPMGEYFHRRGYTVSAPLLAGHGTTPEELHNTSWRNWVGSVQSAYEEIKQSNVQHLYVAGLSMGGILALMLAIEQSIDGVISMCAPIRVKDFRANFVAFFYWFRRYVPRGSTKHPDIEQHLIPYDRTPLKSVGELNRLMRHVRQRLSQLVVPTLVIQSRNDETVSPNSANIIYEGISSKDKTLTWYEKSSHIITLDSERRKLFQEVEEFILRTSVERE
jgi:carboxylesterase